MLTKITNPSGKIWYRLVQAVYFLILAFAAYVIFSESTKPYDSLVTVFIVLEAIKRSIYFIMLGTLFPWSHRKKTYLVSIKETLNSWSGKTDLLDKDDKYLISETQKVANELLRKGEENSNDKIGLIYDLVFEVDSLIRFYDQATKIRAVYLAEEAGIDITNFTIGWKE